MSERKRLSEAQEWVIDWLGKEVSGYPDHYYLEDTDGFRYPHLHIRGQTRDALLRRGLIEEDTIVVTIETTRIRLTEPGLKEWESMRRERAEDRP